MLPMWLLPKSCNLSPSLFGIEIQLSLQYLLCYIKYTVNFLQTSWCQTFHSRWAVVVPQIEKRWFQRRVGASVTQSHSLCDFGSDHTQRPIDCMYCFLIWLPERVWYDCGCRICCSNVASSAKHCRGTQTRVARRLFRPGRQLRQLPALLPCTWPEFWWISMIFAPDLPSFLTKFAVLKFGGSSATYLIPFALSTATLPFHSTGPDCQPKLFEHSSWTDNKKWTNSITDRGREATIFPQVDSQQIWLLLTWDNFSSCFMTCTIY